MRGVIQFLRAVVAANDRFAAGAGQVLSWSIWLTLMMLGTAVWLALNSILPHPFDRGPDYPRLVLILTITTALDAGATKLFQLAQRRSDEARETLVQSQVEDTAELTVAIRAEQDRARERDEMIQRLLEESAARDAATQAVLDRVLDSLEEPEGGVSTNGHA